MTSKQAKTIEKQRALVANWLTARLEGDTLILYRPDIINDGPHYISIHHWNPHNDMLATLYDWSTIIENMSDEEGEEYTNLLKFENFKEDVKKYGDNPYLWFHKVPADIRWKVLVKMIKGRDNG